MHNLPEFDGPVPRPKLNKPKSTRNLVLHINGGLGKCIMATAVIKSYRESYPDSKIVVVSGYPEVFLHNPDVFKNFPFNTPYLWQDYYGHDDWSIYAHDPYMNPKWIKNKKQHFIDIWCEELGIESTQKTPLLYFSGPELDELNAMIRVDKPLVVVQSTGGANPAARSWTRNPPQHELDSFLLQYKETNYVIHLALPETPHLTNGHQRVETLDRRKAMCLVYYCNEFIGLDSFGLHSRAANPNAGKSTFFFPLAETYNRLAYQKPGFEYKVPTQEVQDKLKNHQDYYATVFKLSIEDSSENCPIPPEIKWFDL